MNEDDELARNDLLDDIDKPKPKPKKRKLSAYEQVTRVQRYFLIAKMLMGTVIFATVFYAGYVVVEKVVDLKEAAAKVSETVDDVKDVAAKSTAKVIELKEKTAEKLKEKGAKQRLLSFADTLQLKMNKTIGDLNEVAADELIKMDLDPEAPTSCLIDRDDWICDVYSTTKEISGSDYNEVKKLASECPKSYIDIMNTLKNTGKITMNQNRVYEKKCLEESHDDELKQDELLKNKTKQQMLKDM